MESQGQRPTPEQARTALAEAERAGAGVAALSATPWPAWFACVLTLYIAALPITYGGAVAGTEWMLPRSAWAGVMLAVTAVFVALFAVAAGAWRRRTGVALRTDVLPRRATVPLVVGLPAVLVGAPLAFHLTERPEWLYTASGIGAAVSVGFHLAFVRLHRKTA